MRAHWYFAEHFSELSYCFFSKSKGRFLDELRVSFKEQKLKRCVNMVYYGATKRTKVKDCF